MIVLEQGHYIPPRWGWTGETRASPWDSFSSYRESRGEGTFPPRQGRKREGRTVIPMVGSSPGATSPLSKCPPDSSCRTPQHEGRITARMRVERCHRRDQGAGAGRESEPVSRRRGWQAMEVENPMENTKGRMAKDL